jgi:hypothetical protein
MSKINAIESIELVGGPSDGLVIASKYAAEWPPPAKLKMFRLVGSMIGPNGEIIPPSQLAGRVDIYVRCAERLWRYTETEVWP